MENSIFDNISLIKTSKFIVLQHFHKKISINRRVRDNSVLPNPIVSGAVEYAKIAVNSTIPLVKKTQEVVPIQIQQITMPIWQLGGGRNFIRAAGLSGAVAVALGAYGAHAVYPKEGGEDLKKIYETANRYHFMHTLALLGVPLCRYPKTSGTFMVLGMALFCGTCYYHAMTGNKELRRLTPIGGTFLIIGWLVMAL